MRFVKEINGKEVDAFVLMHPYCHYMKTTLWAEYEAAYEGYDHEFVGVYDDSDILIATALILKRRPHLGLKQYWYIPSGMCLDYNDSALLEFFLNQLTEYARESKASFVRIDPNVERCHHDIDGEVINDGFDNEAVTQRIKDTGFVHKGYGYAYNGSWINRFTLIKDISADLDSVVKSFSKSKIASIKRQEKIGALTVRHGNRSELHYLRDLEFDLAKAQGSAPHSVAFFERMYDSFKDHLIYYIAEFDLNHYTEYLQKELLSKDVRSDPSQKEKREREIGEVATLKEKYGEKCVIGAGIYVWYGYKSWNLYNYKRDDFFDYQPTDLIHKRAIAEVKEKGVSSYDMVGFSGSTDPKDPYYGLYYYKRRFNPRFVEHIGEFDFIIDKTEYERFLFNRKVKGKVLRKVHTGYYKGKDRRR